MIFEFRQNDTLFFPNTNSASKNKTVLFLDIPFFYWKSVFLSDTYSVSLNLTINLREKLRTE